MLHSPSFNARRGYWFLENWPRTYSSSEWLLLRAAHGDVLKYIELFIKSETENHSFQECLDSLIVLGAKEELSAILCSLLAN